MGEPHILGDCVPYTYIVKHESSVPRASKHLKSPETSPFRSSACSRSRSEFGITTKIIKVPHYRLFVRGVRFSRCLPPYKGPVKWYVLHTITLLSKSLSEPAPGVSLGVVVITQVKDAMHLQLLLFCHKTADTAICNPQRHPRQW